MGRRDRTGETHYEPSIYAHRPLEDENLQIFRGVQNAIRTSAGSARFRRRQQATAGLSLITSSKMSQLLLASPRLRGHGMETIADRMRESLPADDDLTLRVRDIDVLDCGESRHLVALVSHPNIWQDRSRLVRTLRGLGSTGLSRKWNPHITLVTFYGGVPDRVIKAAETAIPSVLAVGPPIVELVGCDSRMPEPVQPAAQNEMALAAPFLLGDEALLAGVRLA